MTRFVMGRSAKLFGGSVPKLSSDEILPHRTFELLQFPTPSVPN
jgi:hypothetical protein